MAEPPEETRSTAPLEDSDLTVGTDVESTSEVPDRRQFLRQMSGDAVRTAGRMAGFSSILRRSVIAAGGAAIRDLAAPVDDGGATTTDPTAEQPSAPESSPLEPVFQAPPQSPGAIPPRDPVPNLTPEQQDFLASGGQAILAVNDPSGAPHLTSSMYHWDGEVLRLPGRLSSARAIDIDRDARVTVLVGDPVSEAWVAMTGTASLSSIERVETATLQILGRYFDADVAARRWAELRGTGDPIVIEVRPVRFVWRRA